MFNKNANTVSLPYLLIFTNIHVYGSFHQPSPGSFLTPGQMTPGFLTVFCESAVSTIVNSRTENLLVAGSNGVIHPWSKQASAIANWGVMRRAFTTPCLRVSVLLLVAGVRDGWNDLYKGLALTCYTVSGSCSFCNVFSVFSYRFLVPRTARQKSSQVCLIRWECIGNHSRQMCYGDPPQKKCCFYNRISSVT